ncbi:AA-permease domain-containing protein [Fusarium falciforme]|uniref:AA-permease domain-containing protein n=1 Tax=Fusarium falciforme TaxID=195108 RepID=UPI002301FC52|nr:AA-permease domain-containing protein [Fusarium falciforme]WAO83975.1 AA-permease domain-containing protein [Fusarium falciforme]
MASKANQMEAGEKAVAYDARSNSSDVAAGTMATHEAAIVNAPLDMSELKDMNKGLHSRHLQMMALAGAIGTGLFLSSGRAFAQAGPIGTFLGYTLIGFSAAGVVLAVAEMAALVPLSGGIMRYAEVFIDPALSFAMRCGFFGDLEFGFAMLQIALIFIVNIRAAIIIAGGGPNVTLLDLDIRKVGDYLLWPITLNVNQGFSIDPRPFVQYMGIQGSLGRLIGLYTTFPNTFSGIENTSLAAAETANARRVIPQAAKRVFWRILIFYSLTMFLVGLVVPSNDDQLLKSKGTAASPFVISASLAGIKVIPHVINAIVVTSAWSCGNYGMMSYIRYLFGLVKNRHAPRVFTRLNRFRIPYVADLLSIAILVNWTVILITYLFFFYGCKVQGIDRNELPYRSPFQPYFSWACISLFILILITSGWQNFVHGHWNTKSFMSSYFNIPLALILYFGFRFYKKTKIILDEIPIRAFLDIANADPPPPLKPKEIRKLNFLW